MPKVWVRMTLGFIAYFVCGIDLANHQFHDAAQVAAVGTAMYIWGLWKYYR